MERLSARSCEQWRHAAALDALGGLVDDERAGLLAHLDGCAACREVAAELATTAEALAAVDHDTVHQTASVPPVLAARVLGTLHDDVVVAHRRRRVAAVGGAVVALAASVALVLALALPGGIATPARSRTEVLRGAAGATATAVLTSRSWGTSVAIVAERGLPKGAVYNVAMRTGVASWWATGSFLAPSGRVPPQMACAVPMDAITGIRVTTSAGTTVLESLANPGTTW